jgi:hypothetical protein
MSDKISVTGSHVYREAKSNIFIIKYVYLGNLGKYIYRGEPYILRKKV